MTLNPDGTASGIDPDALVSMRDVDGERRYFYGSERMAHFKRQLGPLANGPMRDTATTGVVAIPATASSSPAAGVP